MVTEEEVAKEVGACGAVVSIVMDIAEDLDETLPAESVAVAFMEYCPSAILVEGVNENAPFLLVLVLPTLNIEDPL